MRPRVVILAGGNSSRMGTCKSLLDIFGQTLLSYQVQFLLAANFEDISVVSNGASGLVEEIERLPVEHLNTHGQTNSMLDSLRYFLQRMATQEQAILVLPGDHPPTSRSLFRKLKQQHEEAPNNIVIPCCGERRGHPILIPSGFFALIQTHFDQDGLRGLLRHAATKVLHVPADPSIHTNLNTPVEYASFLATNSER